MFTENPSHKPDKIRVMLVDDSSMVREVLSSIFKFEPDFAIVAETDNGADAIQLAMTEAPDLVVMDYSMPNMNGIEATRKILEQRPNTRVVLLSAFDDFEHRTQAARAGAKAFFVKPVRDLNTFYDEVRRIVGIAEPTSLS